MTDNNKVNNKEVTEKVFKIIHDHLGVDLSKLSLDMNIQKDLDADSLDVVELIMALEEEFDINIPDEVAQKLRTPKDICDYIESHSDIN